ncbi:MAG TPA: WYL domain-containing protein [Candidatus Binatia bacterium]|nr:WYL domain-containing protein [Candidatus Binatia bacterium]
MLLSFPVTDYREVLGDILRFGADAEVLEPAELRALVGDTVQGMDRLYGGGSRAKK